MSFFYYDVRSKYFHFLIVDHILIQSLTMYSNQNNTDKKNWMHSRFLLIEEMDARITTLNTRNALQFNIILIACSNGRELTKITVDITSTTGITAEKVSLTISVCLLDLTVYEK